MWSRVGASVVVALSLLAAGCGSTRHLDADPSVQVAATTPPSPATWPSYPRFPAGSCWTRPFGGGRPLQAAPSYATALRRVEPAQLVRQILARFGDRRYVLRVELAPPPAITLQHLRGYFAGVRPPADALWAFVSAPTATQQPATPPAPGRVPEQMIAEWEAELVVGGLRDDFCAAGGAPLVGWTIGRAGSDCPIAPRRSNSGSRIHHLQRSRCGRRGSRDATASGSRSCASFVRASSRRCWSSEPIVIARPSCTTSRRSCGCSTRPPTDRELLR